MTKLLADEPIHWQTRPSFWVLLPAVFWSLFALVLWQQLEGILSLLVLQAWVVACCYAITGLYQVLAYRLLVTSERLIITQGLLSVTWREFYLERIDGLSIQQSLLARLLDYGDVEVSVATQQHVVGHGFCHPEAIYQQIHVPASDRLD